MAAVLRWIKMQRIHRNCWLRTFIYTQQFQIEIKTIIVFICESNFIPEIQKP